MDNSNLTPSNSLQPQNKDTSKLSQEQIFFNYLLKNIATASMVSFETGISQKNICRYKRDYEKENLLWEVKQCKCKITNCIAAYLTTDKNLIPKQPVQLKLF